MSKQRKSFIIHFDSLNVLDDLSDEQAGMLFKAIKGYQLGEELELDALTRVAFSPFKNQFSRDAEKYEKLCEKNRLIAENRYNTKSTTGKSGNHSLPQNTKSTDNDSKSKSDSKNDNKSKEIVISRFAEFWDLYGKKVDSSKCKAKFSKLSKSDIDLIFEKLPLYVQSTPDPQYRKNPITWINGKCWNDEIIMQSSQPKSTHTFNQQDYTSGKF